MQKISPGKGLVDSGISIVAVGQSADRKAVVEVHIAPGEMLFDPSDWATEPDKPVG